MTTFKEISGQLIRTLSSDPANPQEGQIWYNNTVGVLKGYAFTASAWASGGSLNTSCVDPKIGEVFLTFFYLYIYLFI